ncbi:phospholipase D family protein [Granulosicoccus antarcticus]|uniref:Cardiolipin synthase C n=1 Tax=Granulosicoccus antarcticus IMCC3135 TaxID=1192854 RepID=A0A2Z2NWL7_9GAMM|nr:phospholipase D family protein [Granulosicoccus antarcticus]ASJ74128.1 Cardiolipin synthase C [Granulosicoccus antarcticus IMCC3135]
MSDYPVLMYVTALIIVVLLLIRVLGNRALKVVPESCACDETVPDTALSEAVDALLDANAEKHPGSLFSPLGKASTALLSRFRLADLAQHTIDAQYYLFHDDEAGQALLANLIEAAGRGVKVRLLLDDIGIKGREPVLARLARETTNLEIRIFNPVWLRPARILDYLARFPRSSRRMHNKSFTVDKIVSIVGGRNIGNEYFNVGDGVSFADFDVIGAGPVAVDVVKQFDAYWHSGIAVEVIQLGKPCNEEQFALCKEQMAQGQDRFREHSNAHEELALEQLMSGNLEACLGSSRVVYDPPQKVMTGLFDTEGNLASLIIKLLSSAQQELLISSPYFIPGKRGMAVFRELRARGVRICLLTNSFAANDVVAVHSGYIDYRQELVEMGVEMYEFKPDSQTTSLSFMGSKRSSLHAKTFIIDRKQQFVGSFNLDPRSAIHNTEMGIFFHSVEFAESLCQSQLERLESSAYRLRLGKSHSLEWIEVTPTGETIVHTTEPDMTRLQRVSVYMLTWLPFEWLL